MHRLIDMLANLECFPSTVAISIIRIKYLNIGDSEGGDVTWQHVESSGWSLGELASALTCSSLPTLRPFVAKYFPSFGMTWTGSTNSQSGRPVGGSGGDPESKSASRIPKSRKGDDARGSADSSVDMIEHELHTFESKAYSTHGNSHPTFDHDHSTYDPSWK